MQKYPTLFHQLLKEDVKFNWDDDCAQAFRTLRIRLMTASVLNHPDFTKSFHVETDASKEVVAAVLCQKDQNGEMHLIHYASRSTLDYER